MGDQPSSTHSLAIELNPASLSEAFAHSGAVTVHTDSTECKSVRIPWSAFVQTDQSTLAPRPAHGFPELSKEGVR